MFTPVLVKTLFCSSNLKAIVVMTYRNVRRGVKEKAVQL